MTNRTPHQTEYGEPIEPKWTWEHISKAANRVAKKTSAKYLRSNCSNDNKEGGK